MGRALTKRMNNHGSNISVVIPEISNEVIKPRAEEAQASSCQVTRISVCIHTS
jgi:hypothetical protein